jgi:hypothetical protein
MGFSLAFLKRGLPLAAIAGVVVFSAQAQRPPHRGAQPILFSSPLNNDVVSNTSSLLPQPPQSLDLSEVAEAPAQFNFNRLSPAGPLPSVMQFLSPVAAARERDLLDRRRNWALLTPAEILGAVTPEKMLGITERDAFGQTKYLTAVERYTERQNQLLVLAKTNAPQIGNESPTWPFSGDRRVGSNSLYGGWGNPESMANPLRNPASDNQYLASPNENRGWSKLFESTPAPTPLVRGPNTAQTEDMERFRQLLNPGSPSAALGATPALGGLKTSLPQTLLNAGLGQPQPARVGASFTPLSSGIGKPAELPKLPGALGLSYTSSPPAAPWAPQPAPWLSPTPQPFVVPQRKF